MQVEKQGAALAFFVGMPGRSTKRSAGAGVISLVVAVLAYYLTKVAQGEYRPINPDPTAEQNNFVAWGAVWSAIVVWWIVACLLGPALGWIGNISVNGPYRLPARLLIPIMAIIETTMRLRSEAVAPDSLVTTTWSTVRVLALGVTIAVAAPAVTDRWRRRNTQKTHAG
ncbi:DUF6518 family protein [Embleya sp. NPDC001921]